MNLAVNLGDLSKPATVLIEKVSEAVGGIAKPWQIKRVAKAEAEADLIRARSKIEVTELLEGRALGRMICEETQKQKNIENITDMAIPHLLPDAKPENVERDWLVRFFDRSRLVSDEQMQSLWSKILAGEANKPGAFSRRTIDIVDSLDKKDAQLFTAFCTFCWMMEDGNIVPLIFDIHYSIYNKLGLNFMSLQHLNSIGLITFNDISGYNIHGFSKYCGIFYYNQKVTIEFPNDKNTLEIGKTLLTQAGKELALICGAKPSNEYFLYIIEEWKKKNYILSIDPS